jgi:hypothetical protein
MVVEGSDDPSIGKASCSGKVGELDGCFQDSEMMGRQDDCTAMRYRYSLLLPPGVDMEEVGLVPKFHQVRD